MANVKKRRSRVPRNRNDGTWTESQYWGAVRSALRRAFRYWKPARAAALAATRPYTGSNKRQKFERQCNKCKKWWKISETQVDHIIPCGSLRSGEDIKGFLERMTPEEGFQVLCRSCHAIKTKEERDAGKGKL